MAIKFTNFLRLKKNSINEQNKIINDNNNLDTIDLKLKQLRDINIKNTTANVKTMLEFLGALDNTKSTITINSVALANPFYNKNISEILVENDIELLNYNGIYIIPSINVKKISSNSNSIIDFNSLYSLKLDNEIEITNLTFNNLGYNNIAINIDSDNVLFENCIFNSLQGSIIGKYERYVNIDDEIIESIVSINKFESVLVKGFISGISLFKNISGLTHLTIILNDDMELNNNILFDTVSNINNVLITSENLLGYEGIGLCGGIVDYNMYSSLYDFRYRGIYNSSNIMNSNCKLGALSVDNGIITANDGQAEYKPFKFNIDSCFNINLNVIDSGGNIINSNNIQLQVEDGVLETELEDCYSYSLNGKYNILDDYKLLSSVVKVTNNIELDRDVEVVMLYPDKTFNVILPPEGNFKIIIKDILGTANVYPITIKPTPNLRQFIIFGGGTHHELLMDTANFKLTFIYDSNTNTWDVV